uniref:Protein FAR1-RELATED SEQUENCE n=1 Tax=Chenopodium quinoa TaxID=63459 RepID=A0A803MWY6_CHEQI
MVFADEVTVYHMDNGLTYDDNPVGGPPPGILGDAVSQARDFIQFRIFMKRLIVTCGITQTEHLIVGQPEFLKKNFMFEYMPLNENGKRVLEIAETLDDLVSNEETWTPLKFTKRSEKDTVDHGEDSDNGDESDVDTDTDTDEIPKSFLDLDVWEKLGRKLEDFTLAEMKQLSFRSHRTCIQFYRMYAKVKGFGIRCKHTTTSKIDGHPTSQNLWCNREGFREAKNLNRPDRKRKEKAVTRCGCNASISFKWDHRSDSWYVKDFVPEHNGHDLIPMNQMYFERSHREVTEGDKFCIKALMNSGVKPSITMRNLAQSAGGIREVGFLKKDLYNTCEKFKREEIKDGDTETVLAYLLGKTTSDPSFFLRYTRDDHDGIDKMFWCDGICQTDYKAFGKRVNHHSKTVPLGVALIANEKTDTYIWVLEQLKEVGGNVAPYTIITDGDKAMAAAITEVFPRAHHRLCMWHLMRNIKGHTNKRFCSGFMKCVDGARTPDEFEEAWEDLMKSYKAVRDKKWAQDLYYDKEKWAEAFMVGQFYVDTILRRWTIREKVHLKNTFKDHDFQKRNDHASANGRYAFLTGLSAQFFRMVSSLYDQSTWGVPVIGRDVHDITHVVRNVAATSETNSSPVKSGGFVELLRNFLLRTYNTGDAANATDSYEVSAFEKFPTIFDWDPNMDF